MDQADQVLPATEATTEASDPVTLALEAAQVMASRTALNALEHAIAAAEPGGDLAAKANEMKAIADASVRAAQHMESQLSAMDALLRMSQLIGR